MLCQNCGKNEVNFKYTQVINGVKKEMALCDKCAKELGLDNMDFNIPINFSSFLGDFFNEYNDSAFLPGFSTATILKCPNCGMSYDDFIQTGKFGCSECYDTFSERINPVLKNIHGSNTHIGRKSRMLNVNNKTKREDIVEKKNEEKNENSELKELNNVLKKAIKEERYEDAAKLRDKIKNIENKK